MTMIAPTPRSGEVVIGTDTHKDSHTAVALDHHGVVLGSLEVSSSPSGLAELQLWACATGKVVAWGVEGTGCYGAGLARTLAAAGQVVHEVNRPNRQARRALGGKSDVIDAEAAARSVLAGFATSVPKAGTGLVECLRMTRSVRSSAVKASTAAMNQLRALVVTAPADLRERLDGLSAPALVDRCCALRPGEGTDPEAVAKRCLSALARRCRALGAEVKAHTTELLRLVTLAAPDLLAEHGVGPDTAAALLIAAGDNPERLHSEAAFAALCGVNPVPASSGKTDKHRLNRSGDRQANCALHRIVVVRLGSHEETRAYMAAHVNAATTN